MNAPFSQQELDNSLWHGIEQLIRQFEEDWSSGRPKSIDFYLPEGTSARRAALRELVHAELEFRVIAGEPARVEDYLDRYPELGEDSNDVVQLIATEFEFRRRLDPQLDSNEFLSRFPIYRDRIRERLSSIESSEGNSVDSTMLASAQLGPARSIPPCGANEELGRYRPVRHHAAGGLGEIVVAEDTQLGRQVALKRIKESLADKPEARRRFVNEAALTARLQHPGIVPVYGLGSYADGRPFYAMRFISGKSLQDAIKKFHEEQSRQSVDYDSVEFRALLRRFLDVCNAVAYAHSRGILHRDLKPGNVMLGEFGETLVVDWGLAKNIGSEESTHGDSASQSPPSAGAIETMAGTVIGTLGYMSPEQAEGKSDELGPTTDVYSLGATLYCLLTGRPPVEANPGDELSPVPAPLAAICRKAMSLKPADRYSRALELSKDVEHWLADEAVGAWREPASVRARRWVRKHRTLASSAVLLGATTIVALAIGLAAVENERQKTSSQEMKTGAALVLADNRFDMAVAAFNEMVFGMQGLLVQRAGTVELRKELLAKARPGLEKLLKEAEAARGADCTLMITYQKLGDVALALGDTATAEKEYREFHRRAMALAAANPKDAQAQSDVFVSFNKLGDVTLQMGNDAMALEYHSKALEVSERLAAADPKNAQAQRHTSVSFKGLGDVLLQMGNSLEALESFSKALEITKRLAAADPKDPQAQRDLSIAFERLGEVTFQMGNYPGALEYHRQALEVTERLASTDPKDSLAQRDISVSLHKLADVTMRMGNAPGSLEYHRKALEVRERLAAADPKDAHAQRDVFFSHYRLGEATFQMGNYSGALEHHRKALNVGERLAAANPMDAQAQRDMAASLSKLGDVTLRMDDARGAFDCYRKALEVSERLAAFNPNDVQAQRAVTVSLNRLGGVTMRMGDATGAISYYRRALDVSERLMAANPKNAQVPRDMFVSLDRLGEAMLQMNNVSGALDSYRKSMEARVRWAAANPKDVQAQRDIYVSYFKLGNVALQIGNASEAIEYFHKALEVNERLAGANSNDVRAQFDLFICYLNLGQAHQKALQFIDAKSWFELAQAALNKFETNGWIKSPQQLIGDQSFQFSSDATRNGLAACGKAEQAVADLQFVLNQSKDEIPGLLDIRLRVLAKKGDGLGCVATAEALKQHALPGADGIYNLVCAWSLCFGVTKDKDHGDKAMARLKTAVEAGFNNVGHMKADKDLDAIRDRDDFKQLIAELEAKEKVKKSTNDSSSKQ